MKFAFILAAAATIAASTATAATVQVHDLGAANAVPVAFADADAITGTVFEGATTSQSGVRRSPWEGTAFDGSVYTSVSGGASATYAVGPSKALSFVWGSPDTYNKLSFFFGNTLLGFITGAQVTTDVKPITTAPVSAPSAGLAFVKLVLDGGLVFDTVKFESGSNAFEYGSVQATPVPLPAAAALLASALAALGLMRRRTTAA
jgi:hypothetical protein